MAKKVYEEENIRAIADKIREITGGDSTYKTAEMPSGIEEVYEAGIIDHNKMLWDSMAKENQWFNTFAGQYWNDTTFNPTIDLIVPYCSALFFRCYITDLKGILDRNGVKLDFSKSTRLNSIFEQSKITRAPIIDTRNCADLQNLLYSASSLSYVEKIIFKDDGSQKWSNIAFNGLPKLEELTVEGVIGSDMTFNNSPLLTHESLMSIINALKNFVEKKTLKYTYGSFSDYSVSGFNTDPKGITFYVTSATLNGTTLVCQAKYDDYDDTALDVTITVTDIDISQEDVANIKTIVQDVVDYNPETGFITDVVITIEKVTGSKTLTLGSTNLAKLTDAEKKKATDKGWTLA